MAQWRAEPVQHLRDVRSAFLAKVLLRQRAGEPLGPLVAAAAGRVRPAARAAGRAVRGRGEADRVIAAWRYESSQAVARLLDHLEALDRVTGSPGRTAPNPGASSGGVDDRADVLAPQGPQHVAGHQAVDDLDLVEVLGRGHHLEQRPVERAAWRTSPSAPTPRSRG